MEHSEQIEDLKLKLDIAESCLKFILNINDKRFDNVPGYAKIRMCRESSRIALEALKLKSVNKNKVGMFTNIKEVCPYCKAVVAEDYGTSVEYKCGNTASRLSGVTYKHCQFPDKF